MFARDEEDRNVYERDGLEMKTISIAYTCHRNFVGAYDWRETTFYSSAKPFFWCELGEKALI